MPPSGDNNYSLTVYFLLVIYVYALYIMHTCLYICMCLDITKLRANIIGSCYFMY